MQRPHGAGQCRPSAASPRRPSRVPAATAHAAGKPPREALRSAEAWSLGRRHWPHRCHSGLPQAMPARRPGTGWSHVRHRRLCTGSRGARSDQHGNGRTVCPSRLRCQHGLACCSRPLGSVWTSNWVLPPCFWPQLCVLACGSASRSISGPP